ncbi:transducin beta-like protein 3 [Penaeus indicus]|uniref:transducin beta-like protein 3 n=1 Tax=Penaeus indicus TaxID=29960 RepID=UPI00300C1CD0
MASKLHLKTNYESDAKFEAYFTGQRVEVTNDGSAVLCECRDSVGIVSLETGQVTGRITCEEDEVVCLSLSPNNKTVAVALKSTSVQQYQWPSLELVRSFRSYHRGPVTTMAWDASSTLLVTGAADSSARIWDLEQKFCTHSLKGASGVFGVVLFHPDLLKLPRVYGSAGTNIHLWNLAAGSSELHATLNGHHAAVTDLSLTHDQKHMLSVGLDRVIILWDLITMSCKKVVPVFESLSGLVLQHPERTAFPGANTDDDHIYAMVVGDKGVPAVWQVDTGREVWKASTPVVPPPEDQEGGVTLIKQLTDVPALDSVLMTTFDHSITLAKTSSLNIWKQLAGYNEQILDAVFVGPKDSYLAVATNSAQLRIYDSANLSCHLLQGHTALILAVARHSTHCNIFATSSQDTTARLWYLRDEDGTAECIGIAVGHTSGVGSIALASGYMVTGSRDTCLKRWKIKSVEDALSKGEDMSLTSLVCSNTEKAHDKDINYVCVSVNGKLIASASQDKTAKVWSGDNLSLLGVLHGHRRGLWCCEFSPSDEILATASADATIKLWTLSDFNNVATLEGHGVSVLKLAWISSGQQLLSTGSDGLLKLWTARSRLCVATFDGHDDRTWALAVSGVGPDGGTDGDAQVVFTGGEDAKLVRWKDVTQEERDTAQKEAERQASGEQTLANLIKDKKWTRALGIAIKLGRPLHALKVVRAILDESPDQLPKVVVTLRRDQRDALLDYAVKWNSTTKSCREAQNILNIVLQNQTPEELEEMQSWQSSLEGLLPYTQRHLKRVSALYQSAGILRYLAASISLGFVDTKHTALPPLDDLAFLQSIGQSTDTIKPEEIKVEDDEDEDEDEDEEEDEDEDEEEEDEQSRVGLKSKGLTISKAVKEEEDEEEEEEEEEVVEEEEEEEEEDEEEEENEWVGEERQKQPPVSIDDLN